MGCGQGLIASAAVCPSCGTASRGFGGQGTKGQKDKTVAILLAVFLSFWTWLYTFDKDKTKFWIGLGVTGGLFFLTLTGIRAFGIFWLPSALGFWIWAIVDTAGRSQSWYSDYPNG
jgi:hypothetical protein